MEDRGDRSRGTGTIEERGGRYRARLRYAGRRIEVGTYPSYEEAEGALQATRDEIEAGRIAPTSSTTLRDWGERWLDDRELAGLHRSVQQDRSRWRAHVLEAAFVDDPIDTITRRAVWRWAIGQMRRPARIGRRVGDEWHVVELDRKVGRKTVSSALVVLRLCLRAAIEEGIIDDNPAEGLRLPVAPRTDDPWTYLTPEEIELVLGSPAIPLSTRLLLQTAIYTGLRAGELWGLRWCDVELEGDRPHLAVRRSYDRPTKSGRPRPVPLLARAREALRALAAQPGVDAGPGSEELVFPRDGRMRRKGDSAGWLDRWAHGEQRAGYRRLAGITRRVRFHDLRHTCASHLIMGTWGRPWRLEEVRDFLGHTDVQVTQRYAHLAPDALHAAAAGTTGGGGAGPRLAPRAEGAEGAASAKGPESPHCLALTCSSSQTGQGSIPVWGLGGSCGAEGPTWDQLRAQAAALLQRVAAGERIDPEDARGLAQAVLSGGLPGAAVAVLHASEGHVLARAIELAGAIVQAAPAAEEGAGGQ